MANKTWKDMALKVGGSDISDYINSQSLASAITMLEQTGMGASVKSKMAGLADIKIDINGFVNTTTEGIFGAEIEGTSVAKTTQFTAYQGRYYNGSTLMSNYQVSGTPDTLETFSATIEFTDSFNRTSIALA